MVASPVRLPHKTKGTGLLCGIYALAAAFADAKSPAINDRKERFNHT